MGKGFERQLGWYRMGLTGCNVGQSLAYIYAPDTTSLDGFFAQPTQAQLEASPAYTARVLFLNTCTTRGLIVSECDFETTPVANYAAALTCPTAGGFVSSFTTQFERFNFPTDPTPSATRSNNVRDNGVGTGRFNAAPTNATKPPGQRWVEGAGNAVNFVFASPMIAFGLYFIDTNDVQPPITSHEPYTLILQTSVGQLTYDCFGTTNLNFFGVFMASGDTITSARIRWNEYSYPPSLEDRLGIDGVLLARCP